MLAVVTVFTHTLLPVSLGLILDNISLATGRGHYFPAWSLPVVGVFGILPDLCTPHLSLEARFTSWSHTAWFLAALAPVAGMVASFFPKGSRWKVALFLWLAAFLHLAADAAAGGLAWLRPWRTDLIGAYYIHPAYWVWCDIGSVVLAWVLVRLRPHAEARGMRA